MSVRDAVIDVLLVLGCGVVVLATCAMLWLPTARDRLHLLAPVSSFGAPLLAAALVIRNGVSTSSGAIVLIVAVLALTGPAAGMAVARVSALREDAEPVDGTQSPE